MFFVQGICWKFVSLVPRQDNPMEPPTTPVNLQGIKRCMQKGFPALCESDFRGWMGDRWKAWGIWGIHSQPAIALTLHLFRQILKALKLYFLRHKTCVLWVKMDPPKKEKERKNKQKMHSKNFECWKRTCSA